MGGAFKENEKEAYITVDDNPVTEATSTVEANKINKLL